MPHRVANFLRTSSGNIAQIKKVAVSRSRTTSPYNSDGEDHPHNLAVKMPDLTDAVKKHHRISLPFGKSSKDHHNSAVSLDWSIESPPIVFHGTPDESTGALVSGQMFIDVKEDFVELNYFTATLNLHTVQKRPYSGHCTDCANQNTELKSWQFLAHPTKLPRGRHPYPFSVLLDGHLPASTDTPLVSVNYEFKADALITRCSNSSTGSCSPVKFEKTLTVKRSLPEPEFPHHSVRVFPPTNIKASAHYNSVIHPTGTSTVTLKLDGLMSHNEKAKTMEFWRLKKITWRFEETVKTTAPACERHMPSTTAEPEKKTLLRNEVRVLAEKHLHEGWKSDFSGSDGTVDMEFDYTVNNQYRPHNRDSKYACDVKVKDGIEVVHSLQIELVVSKEYAPEGKPQMATQTGTGRILRMHYAIVLTDHPGMGVSWDNEAPPVYQDVPPSPPGYPTPEEPPIEYEDLQRLDAIHLSAQSSPQPSPQSSPQSSPRQSEETLPR
ncbi:Fc.00g005370.m01.CDS01 [Cosmosporella sp. VM-42]